jgi:hypothetical protein
VRKWALVATALLIAPQAFAQNSRCTFETCKAGTHAVTYFKQDDRYYACPTRELANYVRTVLGLMGAQVMITGTIPNISDKTGEPEYTGETKMLLDSRREQAQVQTFDEAAKICTLGSNKRKVTILNMPENSMVTYVLDEVRKQTFWMPISHLDKVK